MSSAVVSTSAALGRPFLFDTEPEPEVCALSGDKKPSGPQKSPITQVFQSIINSQPSTISTSIGNRKSAIENSILPASRLEIRPAPEMVTSGIPALDALTGGFPRGCLTEICGPTSSGRTTVLLAALAAATRRGEYCAVIDANDALDPNSLAAAGIDLDRLLWVRCGDDIHQKSPKSTKESVGAARNTRLPEHRLEQVLRATDLLLESGGFGLIILDLADLPPQSARLIPLTTWFRFRRAVEHKPTILLSIEQQPIAGSCSSLLLQLGPQKDSQETMNSKKPGSSREAAAWESPARQRRVSPEKRTQSRRDGTDFGGNMSDDTLNVLHIPHPTHAHLLTELQIHAELIRSRLDRKPAQSITFETKTAWAG